MRRHLRALFVLAVLVVSLGLLTAGLGLVQVAASSGHWPVTNWFLHFTMRQSVQLRAPQGVPKDVDLSDPALIRRGAGHFQNACAVCHGSPAAERPPQLVHMVPPPPPLTEGLGEWSPGELFWIVRHGVKLTGMPAWPAEGRDDEVWSVVAFLLRLPALSRSAYAELALPGPSEGGPLEPVLAGCRRCHDGSAAAPRLTGQSERYLEESLRAFASGQRRGGIMWQVAAALDEPMISAIARYYARLAPDDEGKVGGEGDPVRIARGARVAREGLPEQGVPSCIVCHGPGPDPRNEIFPLLAGQDERYLAAQLGLWAAGTRGGTPYAHLMETVAKRLRPEQIEDLAAYFASLRGLGGRG